jgi:hypothetical protein
MAYQVIDQLEGNAVVASFPTARKATNAARRIETQPEGRRLGYRSCITGHTRDWRYLVRRAG